MQALMEAVQTVASSLNLATKPTENPAEAIVFDVDTSRLQIQTTVIVMKGTLKRGDVLASADAMSKATIKQLYAHDGVTKIDSATAGTPAVLYSFNSESAPPLGSTILSYSNENRSARIDAQTYLKALARQSKKQNISSLANGYKKKVPFVICGDCQATIDTLREMFTVNNDNVVFTVFQESLKTLSETDIRIAEAIGAQIVLFNVDPIPFRTTAKVHQFNIIYDLASSIQEEINEVLPAQFEDVTQGNGTIAEIHGSRKQRIVGVNKVNGIFSSSALFRIYKDGIPVWVGPIASLRFNKNQIGQTDPRTMHECGVCFHAKALAVDVDIGDKIECFVERRVYHKIINDKFFGLSDVPIEAY